MHVRVTRWRMKALGAALAVLGVVAASPAAKGGAQVAPPPVGSGGNVVVHWNNVALQAVRDSKLGPPMVARGLAMVHTCIYDAWAAYDVRAVGTRLGGTLRRPAAERTAANKTQAISYAAYRAITDVFPSSKAAAAAQLASMGYDPANATTDTTTPAGIGNVACQAVLDFRHHDGSNQLGDLHPGAYSDYTGYAPVNAPMVVANFDPATVHDPNRWQPLIYTDIAGHTITQTYIGPQWNQITPFALTGTTSRLRSNGPARYGTKQYVDQAQELLTMSANLTDETKAIAEYWADGPRSELPPGHWNLFAQFVSLRDHHSLDDDAKLFFALTNANLDASIVAWDNKNHFDSERPITAIRYLFDGKKVLAWGGPGQGTKLIDGKDWLPYQPSYFPTPPFPEYSSGHSTFSAAAAEILRLFTRSDAFGGSVTIAAGSSKVEPGIAPATDVTLSWATFTDAANQAGISRRYGGIHFAQGDLDARAQGRLCGGLAWTRALSYFNGAPR